MAVNGIATDLKRILLEVIERGSYGGLLFSGGLDTSILAVAKPKIIGITVSLGFRAEDIRYAEVLAKSLDIEHFHRRVEINEAIEAIPKVIKILGSFDPAIPNDLVVYFGLESAKELGIDRTATGDGSDELFGGYLFMQDIDDLETYIYRLTKKMHFNSNVFGEFFKIKIIQPFISREIIDFALQIPSDLKIKKDKDKIWGKWILRKAFEDLLPESIIWQKKRALEYGSGMYRLRQIISDRVVDEEFREKSTSIKFINKEHFYYYKIYREVVGEIPKPTDDQKICSACKAGVDFFNLHCRICGSILDH